VQRQQELRKIWGDEECRDDFVHVRRGRLLKRPKELGKRKKVFDCSVPLPKKMRAKRLGIPFKY
jgi:hypothetical protein